MSAPAQRVFASDYQTARALFLDAASRQPGRLEFFEHSGFCGPDGGALGVDVLRLGPDDARKVVLVVSGTHGVEGFAGSAGQCSILHGNRMSLPADTALVLVHAINPHGFAYERRVNEHNIDLNRNFIDHDCEAPEAGAYSLLHDSIVNWDGVTLLQNEPVIARFSREHGQAALQAALTSGQRSHSDGLFFAGSAPCWSNKTWRRIAASHAAEADLLLMIDIHTGLGPHGAAELLLLTGDEKDASRIFSAPLQLLSTGGTSGSSTIRGTLVSAAQMHTRAQVIGIALEIGTAALPDMLNVLRMEHWLRHHTGAPESLAQEIRRRMRATFYDDSREWREAVLRHVHATVIAALARV